jgi:ribosomal protein L40E
MNDQMSPFAVFLLGAFIITGIAVNILVLGFKNTALKQKWSPILGILSGIFFAGFLMCCFLHDEDENQTSMLIPIVISIPVIALIIFMNIRMTKFCEKCGATLISRTFGNAKFCEKCGAELPKS